MSRTLISRCVLFLFMIGAVALVMTACKEKYNFYEAIDYYGLKSKLALGKKDKPIDRELLGGYLNKGLPVVISQKDENTYNVTFLHTTLEGEDIVVDAFKSEINGQTYLNLQMGKFWSFLKYEMSSPTMMSVSLLRNTVSPYVDDDKLADWLGEYQDQEEYTGFDSLTISIWYDAEFDRISTEGALKVQAEMLEDARQNLFRYCYDYETYDGLALKYPGDPLLSVARENIYGRCKDLASLEKFVRRFPDDPLVLDAKQRIAEIMQFKQDSVAYLAAKQTNAIPVLLAFSEHCKTPIFKDSAASRVMVLADAIRPEDVEWKWTNSERGEALQLIYYKIDYAGEINDFAWYQNSLTLYSLIIGDSAVLERGLKYLEKLVQWKPERERMLDMYISKGFLFWSLGKTEHVLNVFALMINEKYYTTIPERYKGATEVSFRAILDDRYKYYKSLGLKFPKEKKIWKKIKKL